MIKKGSSTLVVTGRLRWIINDDFGYLKAFKIQESHADSTATTDTKWRAMIGVFRMIRIGMRMSQLCRNTFFMTCKIITGHHGEADQIKSEKYMEKSHSYVNITTFLKKLSA